MGLAGGDNGPKAVLRRECPSAFREVATLEDLRCLFGVDRAQTLAILDGNVILRGLPAGVETYSDVVDFFGWKVVDALRAAAHVVVVFDDAACITRAKAKEQAKRDAAAKRRVPVCSDDLVPFVVPTTDDYGIDALLHPQFSGAHLMANERAARPRFIDAVAQGVLAMATRLVQREFTLAFDGVDARGAARPAGEARIGGVLATDPVWETVLKRRTPIGEGDLKFSAVCQSVRDAVAFGEAGTTLCGVCLYTLLTIDTDSYLIELLEQSRRRARIAESNVDEWVVLCMWERARKRRGDDHSTPAHLLACDIDVLYECLTQRLFGTINLDQATAARVPNAMVLLAAAWALCGTDFVRLQGVRADIALNVVAALAKADGGVDGVDHLRSDTIEGAMKAGQAIERFINSYVDSIESNKRLSRSRNNASAYESEHVKQCVWNVAYWLGIEHKDVEAFGF